MSDNQKNDDDIDNDSNDNDDNSNNKSNKNNIPIAEREFITTKRKKMLSILKPFQNTTRFKQKMISYLTEF